MLTQELKQQIATELQSHRQHFGGSDAKYATSIGINSAVYNRLKNGETEKLLSDAMWISLARQLGINIRIERQWMTAETPVFTAITEKLTLCQDESISCIICDAADIGKTYTAKHYAKYHKYVAYVDCSQVKSKQKLVRFIAKELGVGHTGKYADVYADLVFYIQSIPSPLIILDEAGDLNYDAFLELKALWNATERACGWCMMGADGLKEKIRRAIECKKVGYTELFSRYGSRYQRITPDGKEDSDKFSKLQAALIVKANAPENTDVSTIIRSAEGSLRRISIELQKLN